MSASLREEDRRVVPLWQRTVSNGQAYLAQLAEKQERQYRELAGRLNVGSSYELFSAASVTIIAPVNGCGRRHSP